MDHHVGAKCAARKRLTLAWRQEDTESVRKARCRSMTVVSVLCPSFRSRSRPFPLVARKIYVNFGVDYRCRDVKCNVEVIEVSIYNEFGPIQVNLYVTWVYEC